MFARKAVGSRRLEGRLHRIDNLYLQLQKFLNLRADLCASPDAVGRPITEISASKASR